MDSELNKIDIELEKLLLRTNDEFNHPKVLQKMMFILLISENEVSMEELAKRTKYSLATLSNTIKQAEKMNMVVRIPHAKTKRVYVKAKYDFYDLIKRTLKTQHDGFVPKVSKLKEIENKYKTIKSEKINKRIKFIKDVKRMNEKIKKINEILEEE